MTECLHPNRELRKRVISNGTISLVNQCLNCGQVGSPVKKGTTDLNTLPEFDPNLFEKWREKSNAEWKEKSSRDSEQWWENYQLYLKSPHWKIVRAIVLRRDAVCQVCFSCQSAHAHHLSYASIKSIGVSFAIECVGVCVPCHEMIHRKELQR